MAEIFKRFRIYAGGPELCDPRQFMDQECTTNLQKEDMWIIDDHGYPWIAYQGDRFLPKRVYRCHTLTEMMLYDLLSQEQMEMVARIIRPVNPFDVDVLVTDGGTYTYSIYTGQHHLSGRGEFSTFRAAIDSFKWELPEHRYRILEKRDGAETGRSWDQFGNLIGQVEGTQK